MTSLRILVADDHPVYRGGMRTLLETTQGIEVVGEATTGEEAVTLAIELRPDVVVMDIQMPEINGIEATRRITENGCVTGVLILTMFEDDDSVFAAIRAGAHGYVLKGAEQDEIIRAIHAVGSGEAIFGPGIAMRMMEYFSAQGRGGRATAEPFPELTDREREVLELIAAGLSNAEITKRLVVSPKTARNHVSNIFTKLQVADRGQAIVRAREAGMGRGVE